MATWNPLIENAFFWSLARWTSKISELNSVNSSQVSFSTCKLVADVVPGVFSVGITGWNTVPAQVLPQVPALSLIKGVEEEGELPDIWLHVLMSTVCARLTDNQRTNQTRMKVSLLKRSENFLLN